MRLLSVVLVGIFSASPTLAADLLTRVVGPVVPVPGDRASIIEKAERCLTQPPDFDPYDGAFISSTNAETGVVSATNGSTYRTMSLVMTVRSRMLLEARDGRFRIEHTDIASRNRPGSFGFDASRGGYTWGPIYKQRFSGWANAEKALQVRSDELAACVVRGPPRGSPKEAW